MAYMCNRGTKHMFSGPAEVSNWVGLTLPQDKIPEHFSKDLINLLGRMVHPDSKARPSAGQVYDSCTDDRMFD